MVLESIRVYLLAIFIFVTFINFCCADICRWPNEKGKVHYSDRMPDSKENTGKLIAHSNNESAIGLEILFLKQSKSIFYPSNIEMLCLFGMSMNAISLANSKKLGELSGQELYKLIS